jgi:agmatinase
MEGSIKKGFNPSGVGVKGSLFGLPFTPETSKVVVIPVPWDVTVSYRAGTAQAPLAILEASSQIDFYHEWYPDIWKEGFAIDDFPEGWASKSRTLRKKVEPYIEHLESGGDVAHADWQRLVNEINGESAQLNRWVEARSGHWQDRQKIVGTLGGDHSTPLGNLNAIAARHKSFGILQIDAHADLRKSYEGFQFSHASIMYNALQLPEVHKIVTVGLRDYCQEEVDLAKDEKERIVFFTNTNWKQKQFNGTTWSQYCREIINTLPESVYISFDIDGLSPDHCPNTGTPVPGGLNFDQAAYLIHQLVISGRKIIGFDLNEVGISDNEWDENVGFRMLYHLCACSAYSAKLQSFQEN